MRDLPWGSVPAFIAAAETGSLSAAARRLGVAQPTVRRQIEALERALGAPLFTRAPAGLAPTAEALALLPDARAMQSAARAMTRRTGGIEGAVRVTATRLDAAEVLPEALAPILAAHPGLAVEIDSDDGARDILRRDADIALTQAEPKAAALVSRKLARREFGLFAAPGAQVPERIEEMRLVTDDAATRIEAARRAAGLPEPAARPLRTDDYVVQLAAVKAGLGVGALQVSIAERHGLVRVRPEVSLPLDSWLAVHEDLRHSPRVDAVWRGLVAALG